ncbi:MAG: hypothetical protein M1561_04155 [Gammaproteobacteria bacterium]|nr:hypothetical protein [Gammaproteobacteria bacterium]
MSDNSTSLVSTSSASLTVEKKGTRPVNPLSQYIWSAIKSYNKSAEKFEGLLYSVIFRKYYLPGEEIDQNDARRLTAEDNAFIKKTVEELSKQFGEPSASHVSALSSTSEVAISTSEITASSLQVLPSSSNLTTPEEQHIHTPTPWVIDLLNRLFYFNFFTLGAALLFTFLPGVQIWGVAFGALAALAFSSLFTLFAKLNSPDSWKEHCKSYDALGYIILSVLILATLLIITNGFSLLGTKGIGISSPVIDTFASSSKMIAGIASFLVFSFGALLYNGLSTKWEEHQEVQLHEKALQQIKQFQPGQLARYSGQNQLRHVKSETNIVAANTASVIPRSGSESNLIKMKEEKDDVSSALDSKRY